MKTIYKYLLTGLVGIILGLILCAKTKYFNHGCTVISISHDTTYITKIDTLKDVKIIKINLFRSINRIEQQTLVNKI